MWVCPCNKSPLIEVSISKFGPKMHLSTVKVPRPYWFWAWLTLIFSFIFNLKAVLFYQTLHLLFICIGLYIFSETIASECSTFHRAPHIYRFLYARGQGPAVKQSSFISWWDHRSSMSCWLGNWHWILQAPIGFRQFTQFLHTSHDAILYANIRQSQKQK